ncbi:MAG: hypothetical protein R3F48_01345 [Candidatus Zixiibacteriota bacterium]
MALIQRKDIFVGREKEIEIFRQALAAKFGTTAIGDESAEPMVLVFHGVAGIGKSEISKKLMTETLTNVYSKAIGVQIDLEETLFHTPESGTLQIRERIHSQYGVKFPVFDIAYAVYFAKAYPDLQLSTKSFALLGHSEILSEITGVIAKTPIIGWAPKIGKLLGTISKSSQEWWRTRGNELLQQISSLETHQIVKYFPAFIAEDLASHFKKTGLPVVIFIDTYEKIWGDSKDEPLQEAKDKWIVDLAKASTRTMFVITGRRPLTWEKRNSFWNSNRLIQHEVVELEPKFADDYMSQNHIPDAEIRDKIYKSSEGVPFYIDLSIDDFAILSIQERLRRLMISAERLRIFVHGFAGMSTHSILRPSNCCRRRDSGMMISINY